ncbi:MAG: accessory factor UbiK family protein [Gammaproteobacteria bacterium]|jgi:BMFP domain-containing protein YqiC|nr:accessory factor UbiK family protein [Gammaproteobacteria bacterium]
MIDFRSIDELSRKLAESVPENLKVLKDDLQSNFKAVLSSGFERMELVTREEFDAQKRVLERLREQLSALEARLDEQIGNKPD